jgi:hypothetical protein
MVSFAAPSSLAVRNRGRDLTSLCDAGEDLCRIGKPRHLSSTVAIGNVA